MAVFKRGGGRVWYYSFVRDGQTYRASTRQTNKRAAEEIEAAVKTKLAKGEFDIAERRSPSLSEFAHRAFLPAVESNHKAKPNTVEFYSLMTRNLLAFRPLAEAKLNAVTPDAIQAFVVKRQADGMAVASINRELATLRKLLRMAKERGDLKGLVPTIRLLSGEARRERTLSREAIERYLVAAENVGRENIESYEAALQGIRAVLRGQHPQQPTDPYLLRDVMTILFDCALRPEECYRLTWSNFRDDVIEIHSGKTDNARRKLPCSARVAAILARRRLEALSDRWVFPSGTKSGHIEQSTVRGQHVRACKLAGIAHFVLYTARHSALTLLSKEADPYTLAKLAGHASFATTARYVHPEMDRVRQAMHRAGMVMLRADAVGSDKFQPSSAGSEIAADAG